MKEPKCLCNHEKDEHYALNMPNAQACRGRPSCYCIKYEPKR